MKMMDGFELMPCPFCGGIELEVQPVMGAIAVKCGAFGVSVESAINWDYLASEIDPVTGCDNSPNFCQNDNFVSLWELMWNYNQEENMCGVIEVIGNIHDNPELVRKDKENGNELDSVQ